MATAWIDEVVQSGRTLRDVGEGILSTLGPDNSGSPYDRAAAIYDGLVGNGLYNRVVWGSSPLSYGAFAEAAVANGSGPLLDVGCGSAVFTTSAYRRTDRRLVLVDRSLGMLSRAAQRLRIGDEDSGRIVLVQADLFDLPFRQQSFATVTCFGLLHLFDDAAAVLAGLRAQLAPIGSLFATSLVGETAIGRRALGLLHRAGEAAPPRSEEELATAVRDVLGQAVVSRREGSMAFLTARTRPDSRTSPPDGPAFAPDPADSPSTDLPG